MRRRSLDDVFGFAIAFVASDLWPTGENLERARGERDEMANIFGYRRARKRKEGRERERTKGEEGKGTGSRRKKEERR
jgi:hypothetical protein